jgi:hypothetical protein
MQNYPEQRVITSSDFRDGGGGFDYHGSYLYGLKLLLFGKFCSLKNITYF